MTLANYEFNFNDFTFGASNSPFQILRVDGLESTPDLRVQDDIRGYNDGMFTGRDFVNSRTITLTMQVFASGGSSAQTNLQTLRNVLQVQRTGVKVLRWKLPNQTEKFIYGRVRKFLTPITPEYTYGRIDVMVEIFCPNPIYYDYPNIEVTFDIGVTVNNTGTWWLYPYISASSVAAGDTLLGLTMQYAANNVVIDCYNKYVTAAGSPARNLVQPLAVFPAYAPATSNPANTSTEITLTYGIPYI